MTPSEFIKKWGDSRLRERQGSQEHFIDLCHLLGERTPADADPLGEHFCFERGAEKVGGGDGWADVWRKGCFGWEYKGKRKDLGAALRQLQAYALDLENPPYLVVSDMERIVVHTNWTNTVSRRYEFNLPDLYNPEKLDDLRGVFRGSDRLKPGENRQELTAKAAINFGKLGLKLQDRGHSPRDVAHFLNRIVFCMFAEDAELLPKDLFTRTIRATSNLPLFAQDQLEILFGKMCTGGFFGPDIIRWFNGGLFEDAKAIPLEVEELNLILSIAAENDWSEIDPAIFGTLFEQALSATRERPTLGAHYTDREKILGIVNPTIVKPLAEEWENLKLKISNLMQDAKNTEAQSIALGPEIRRVTSSKVGLADEQVDLLGGLDFDSDVVNNLRKKQKKLESRASEYRTLARSLLEEFQVRLSALRVLDPACGSGNFLYVALHELRDLEQRAVLDSALLGLPPPPLRLGIENLLGIEIEPYAAELARVTLWIGNLQWLIRRGYRDTLSEPLLIQLNQIQNADALLNDDGTEFNWPTADVIIGNPPFLGGRKLKPELGAEYVHRLRQIYSRRVPEGADLVCYWFEKARQYVADGLTHRVGLVATNSISGGSNRTVLSAIAKSGKFYHVWRDEPWVIEGASVRVSLICFENNRFDEHISLDGHLVDEIYPDLTGKRGSSGIDLSGAVSLDENCGIAFQGLVPRGEVNRKQKNFLGLPDASFLMPGSEARRMLAMPVNPNGRPNSDVLRTYLIGDEITTRSLDRWIVDFADMSEEEAALYEAPFQYILPIKAHRAAMNQPEALAFWWRHWNSRPKMRKALTGLSRYIATPRVSKHRLFVWKTIDVLPDCQVVAIARDDDATFGLLHSRFHELWTLRMCTYLGVGNDPRYTPSTAFETFPFPASVRLPNVSDVDDAQSLAISRAAINLNNLRNRWLSPDSADEVGSLDKSDIYNRTLTNLYNNRPAWLSNAHSVLDGAVAKAYGWAVDIDDNQALFKLLSLNAERSGATG